MSGKSLKSPAHVDEFADPVVLLIHLLHVRILLQRLIQRHSQFRRHHLGDGIHKAVRQVHDAPHVPDHSLGLQSTEGDDLHNLIFPVLLRHILDDFASAFESEVHVYIGHGYSLGIEKPLKEQVIFNGINVRDVQTIRGNASCRASSSGTDHNVVFPGEIDVVPDDQEVIHIAHLADGVKLILQSLPQSAVVIRIALLHAVVAELVQVSPGVIAFRHLEVRELCDAELDLHIAALRDLMGVVQRLPGIGKQGAHLHLALDEELPARIPHPVLI